MVSAKVLTIEAIATGFIVLIVGILVSWGMRYAGWAHVDLPEECKSWSKRHVMEISLFATGVLLHFICEAVGINDAFIKSRNSYKN
jgi:hypothetical protein